MADIVNNHWLATDDEFSTRVEISDLSGFFSKMLVIEPGIVAMFLENGQSIGDVRNGRYNLQSLSDRLSFWNRKSISAILARESELFLEFVSDGIPTIEFLEVEISVRIGVQIEDVSLFQKNLLGSKTVITKVDLIEILSPIVRQGLWEGVSRLSIKDLVKPQSRGDLELCITQSLGTSLMRMGLKFSQVQTLSVSHPTYDEHLRRTSETWLQTQSELQDQAESEALAELFKKNISNQVRTDELELLSKKVVTDRLEGELALKIKRLGIRKALNEALQAKEYDDLILQQKIDQFHTELEKERILRVDEVESFNEILKNKNQDQEAKRQQILKKIELEQFADLASLRIDLNTAQELKTRKHELALAEINDTEESRKWRNRLQKEADDAENRRVESLKQLRFDRETAIIQSLSLREEEMTDLLHKQQFQRVKLEVDVERVQREQRITLIETETKKSKNDTELELKRREDAYHLEHKKARSDFQLDRLRQIQELNHQTAEKEKRLNVELDQSAANSEHLRKIEELKVKGNLSTEVLIATSESGNAAFLVEMKKHEISQSSALHLQNQLHAEKLNEARLSLYRQMNEAEKSKADAIAEAYKMALQAQVGTVSQVVAGFSQASRPQSVAAPPPPPPPPPPQFMQSESWYAAINSERLGPVSLTQMRQFIIEGRIRQNTLVWNADFPNWLTADKCHELIPYFSSKSGGPPPLP